MLSDKAKISKFLKIIRPLPSRRIMGIAKIFFIVASFGMILIGSKQVMAEKTNKYIQTLSLSLKVEFDSTIAGQVDIVREMMLEDGSKVVVSNRVGCNGRPDCWYHELIYIDRYGNELDYPKYRVSKKYYNLSAGKEIGRDLQTD
ncbi:MAG: hypothetical protein A2404_10795 [Bdellovibrionales bacterium RIFOXYC1_FULL_39_130]|nr:MAG: hypothetical protein A2485_16325 [Bdellovibrionales bacterium RIFOXYC12_FULL_39_17]OFZ44745.1 MAG: hypothetical protein A2404_10795 [Bdellovibrionales bacterium RIFOXYC1_FULL_39_130]